MARIRGRLVARVACCAALLAAPAPACTGDCDGDGRVAVEEIVQAVGVALGRPLSPCRSIDRDGSGAAEIDELLAAVARSLTGCPATPTPTPPSSGPRTPTPTPTAADNQPPLLPTASIYRTYPGLPIRLSLDARDPEGGPVDCAIEDLPSGAAFDAASGVLGWTPSDAQLGVFYLPYRCADAEPTPATAAARLAFRVSPLDGCAIPDCEPAAGCTAALAPVGRDCCAGEPTARVPEPVAGCPEGRVLYVGQSRDVDGFGRLQNCDTMWLRHFRQSGAEARFHIETRCMNSVGQVRLHARMDSDAADHPLLFDTELSPFELAEYADGFARRRNLRFAVLGSGPFFDVQDADANLTLTLTDADGASVSHSVRLRLTFTPRPTDLPEVDATPPPTPTRTAAPPALSPYN